MGALIVFLSFYLWFLPFAMVNAHYTFQERYEGYKYKYNVWRMILAITPILNICIVIKYRLYK